MQRMYVGRASNPACRFGKCPEPAHAGSDDVTSAFRSPWKNYGSSAIYNRTFVPLAHRESLAQDS